MVALDVPELPRNYSTKLRFQLAHHRRFVSSSWCSKIAFEKCRDFCGYTPSKKREIVGSTDSQKKICDSCKSLILGNIEQF